MKKFLVVDGNSILNRAYFGIRPLTTKDGLNTNAVYGVITILRKHLDAFAPDYAAVAFDLPAPTFRHKRYEGYKATRKGMPPELAEQLPYAKKVAAAMGFRLFEIPGYEADDILGTLSRFADEDGGVECRILTGDRDSLQLISEHTSVMLARNKEDALYDRARFFEEYGVYPERFIDVKALMGDSSDNIPGVAGIGEKTALKLIAKYSTLEVLYGDLDGAPVGAAAREKLRAGVESAYLSRELATICREAPLPPLDDCVMSEPDKGALRELFTKLEFNAFIKRFGLDADDGKGEPASVETAGDSATNDNAAKAGTADAGDRATDAPALYLDGDMVYTDDGELPLDADALAKYDGAAVLTHGYGRLWRALSDVGVNVLCAFDCELAAYVLRPEAKFSLEALATAYLGDSSEIKPGRTPSVLRGLYGALALEIERTGCGRLLYEIEQPLAAVLAEMTRTGVKVDVVGLRAYGETLRASEEEYRARIYEAAGCEFNINSPKQLGEVLFDRLGLPHGKKTKTGWSTNADVLESLRPFSPIVADVLDYRRAAKLRATYCEGLEAVADENCRVHTRFNQTLTATGRLSSSDPNLQNIPTRTALGRELRRCFTAESERYVLVDADYSQIELRLLACISGDEHMTAAFASGEDIHATTAASVFGVPFAEVTPELRSRAKAVNFGIVYGIGDFSLSADLGITRAEAAEYIKGYLAAYPQVDAYLKRTVEDAKRDGYVTTMFGRRRYIAELSAQNKMTRAFGERVAMNSPIQGAAADIIKIAMINVARALREAGLDARLVLQVHDELIVESNRDCAEEAARILRREMEGAAALPVALTAETTVGETWYDCK